MRAARIGLRKSAPVLSSLQVQKITSPDSIFPDEAAPRPLTARSQQASGARGLQVSLPSQHHQACNRFAFGEILAQASPDGADKTCLHGTAFEERLAR